ncbi:MAG: phenylalanine--tRNA ligase subunit beta [Candidatus Beckwithbacteria bacterium]|nr:phenylalanine--tRNA ligase subunit beta [Candidatus Beckwithbacteria bacterium]
MNITIPHSWLTDFLQTDATPSKIAECLSLCGPSVEKLTKTKDDYLYEIEVTTNRVDCMSVMGIAREAAAILPQFGFKAKLKNILFQPAGSLPVGKPFPLKVIVDQQLCPRFSAVVIKDVAIKPSPKMISGRLEKSGIRSLNNVIDISNYLMRAYGQPVHAFDFDKINKIMKLRLSKKGEKITTLDNKTFTLTGKDIVIEDASGQLIDLCGIMGGFNTAVDVNTKNILLFVQTYNPINIRYTSMSLAQRTEAATLFEKASDPELVMPVLIQGIQLFKQLTNGRQGSKIIDLYPKPYQPKMVKAPLQLIKERLGIEITQPEVDKILNSLGFINGSIPSWRAKDINIPEDIVEEVARIYGYHRLPSQIMTTAIPTNYPDEKFSLEYQLKTWLTGMGLTEIYTNSMVSKELAVNSGFPLSSHLKIKNALSEDWQYLRRSLIPSHTQSFPAFEIANVYIPRPGKLPEEKLQLIISGINDYLRLKGIVEVLSAKLHTAITPQYQPTSVVIDLLPVFKKASIYPHYQPVSSHPPIIEDLTFTLPGKTLIGPILEAIKKIDKLIKSVNLSQTYQHNFTFTLVYQSLAKDLSVSDIAPIRQKIVTVLSQKFHAQLVGKI